MASGIPTLNDAIAEPVADAAPPARESIPEQAPHVTRHAGDGPAADAPERSFSELARRCSDLEQRLADAMTMIDSLNRQIAMTQQAVLESNAARQDLVRDLRDCDARLAELEQAAPAGGKPRRLKKEIKRRDQEIESLSGYIESRRGRWEEMEELVAAKSRRIDELEQEVRQRLEREERAERLAREESQRATELKTRLAGLSSGQHEHGSRRKRETAPATEPPDGGV